MKTDISSKSLVFWIINTIFTSIIVLWLIYSQIQIQKLQAQLIDTTNLLTQQIVYNEKLFTALDSLNKSVHIQNKSLVAPFFISQQLIDIVNFSPLLTTTVVAISLSCILLYFFGSGQSTENVLDLVEGSSKITNDIVLSCSRNNLECLEEFFTTTNNLLADISQKLNQNNSVDLISMEKVNTLFANSPLTEEASSALEIINRIMN